MKKLMTIIVVLSCVASAIAQDFSGQIMNSKQNPVKGMKVWRKNTMESVASDKLGMFAFSGISPADTLVITVSKNEEAVFPIYKLEKAVIKLEKNFFLLFDGTNETKLDYRKVPRTIVNPNVLVREQIMKISPTNIYDLFRGTIPGINVKDGSSGTKITVRGGNSSFEQDTEPLFVINGKQIESSNDANSEVVISDIERVEVLKDGAGYGVRGANGVIVITTVKK